jgi:hypothetical protein
MLPQYSVCSKLSLISDACAYRDTESATFSIMIWLNLNMQLGSSLGNLDADSFVYCKQMKALKRDQAAAMMKHFRQVFLNLLGRNNGDNPTRLAGDSFSEYELERCLKDPFFGPIVRICQGMLWTYFGDYVRHAEMAIQMGSDDFTKAHVASSSAMWDSLFKGLSCIAAARETGKKKYAKMGQIFRTRIKTWLSQGNPNVKHYDSLLDAEWMALKGNKFVAIKHYEVAILVSARGGYHHDAALATERLGDYYLTVMSDREMATYQIGESIKFWGEWGAMAKVAHLQEKYADLMPKPTDIVLMPRKR